MISYAGLWDTMRQKGVTQHTLIRKHSISPAQITRSKRNERVSTHTLEVFFQILDCRAEDVMEYVRDEE